MVSIRSRIFSYPLEQNGNFCTTSPPKKIMDILTVFNAKKLRYTICIEEIDIIYARILTLFVKKFRFFFRV